MTEECLGWHPTVCQDSHFLVATQIRPTFSSCLQQRAVLNLEFQEVESAAPSPEVWILQVSVQVHLTYIATYCPPSSLTKKLAWGLVGMRLHCECRKRDGACTSRDPSVGCSICSGLFRITAFLSLFLRSLSILIQKQIIFWLEIAKFLIRWKQTSLHLMSEALFVGFNIFIDLGI